MVIFLTEFLNGCLTLSPAKQHENGKKSNTENVVT